VVGVILGLLNAPSLESTVENVFAAVGSGRGISIGIGWNWIIPYIAILSSGVGAADRP